MSDLFDKVTEGQDPFTKILGKIPGFKGYLERTRRRNADKILREQIAAEYSVLWKRVGEVQSDLVSAGELLVLDDIETAAIKLQTFIDKISGAPYGYSGFFDAIKIKEEELAKIYEFDAALLDGADEISLAIDNLEASVGTDGLPAAIRHLVGLTRELVTAFESRDQILTEIE